MQSLNEVMPKRYQIKSGETVLDCANDLGSLMSKFMQLSSKDSHYLLIDSKSGVVLSEKGTVKNEKGG